MFDAINHTAACVETGALMEVCGARIAVTVRSVEVAKPLKAHGAGSESFFGSSIPTVSYCHCDGGKQALVDTAVVVLPTNRGPGTELALRIAMMTPGTTITSNL